MGTSVEGDFGPRQQTVDSLLELRVTHNDLPAWTGAARHVLRYYIIQHTAYRIMIQDT